MVWAPLGILALVCVRLTFLAAGPIRDPDSWWHLRMGRSYLSGTWTLRDTGQLSTFATESWVPRDWMPQVVAAQLEIWFGLPGVAWLYGAVLMTFVVTAYVTCRRHADPLPATLAVAITTLAASGSLSQRPQVISFVFMLLVVTAWLATIRDGRPRWWLVPLTWVWACSHGMWYCGIALGFAVVVGLAIDRRWTRVHLAKLAVVPALCLLAAAVTPVGPRLLLTVFDTVGMWQFVTEWAAPSFRDPGPASALLMIFVVVTTWARRTSPAPWAHVALLVVAVGWILLSARTVALGAVVLAPLVAGVLHTLSRPGPSHRTSRSEVGYLSMVVAACLAGLALAVPTTAAMPGDVPSGLDDELAALPAGSPILNAYELGGWLHWRHPTLQTVVDGFTDGYTTSAVAEYGTVDAVAAGWEDYLMDTGVTSALLAEDSPLATALVDRLQWQAVDTDGGYVLLRAPDAPQPPQPSG